MKIKTAQQAINLIDLEMQRQKITMYRMKKISGVENIPLILSGKITPRLDTIVKLCNALNLEIEIK